MKKILEIESSLKNITAINCGLLNGYFSLSFFYAYANKTDNIYLQDEMNNSIQNAIELFSDKTTTHTFCDGLAGSCWGLSHLVKKNKIDANLDELLCDIENHLETTSSHDFQVNYFDFLHGGLGACIYFLDRLPNKKAELYLIQTVKLLNEKANRTSDGAWWENTYIKLNDDSTSIECNCGLSHGMPSIIWFLSKCYTCNIEREKCLDLLNDSVNWLIKKKSINNNYKSIYPIAIGNGLPLLGTRLAWCYGDLGIATTIWQAGIALNNNDWKQEAIDIMLHSAKRRDLKENGVLDAGICHGTAGIAHIFNRFYKETGLKEFDEARWYWINETLNMATHKDGLAGYKAWQAEKGWQNEYGLLEGVSGIGLVLLGFLTDDVEDLSWDRCLLLS